MAFRNSYYTYNTTDITKEELIQFYEQQHLMLTSIGVGGETRFGTEVTEKLIKCTANRLDQLIKGKKTTSNMSRTEMVIKLLGRGGDFSGTAVHDSNRSFCGYITSKFQLNDLEPNQVQSVYNYIDYGYGEYNIITSYIDKYTTAYNSEIVMANLSHDN